MDFTPTELQEDATALAAMVFKNECTAERLKAMDATDDHFDAQTWQRCAEAGLLGLPLPAEHTGSGMGLLELCRVLIEAGRHLAPVPIATHVPTAMAIARFGNTAQQAMWLEGAVGGQVVIAPAIAEERAHVPEFPETRADNDGTRWLLSGTKTVVPSATVADLFVVPAMTQDGATAFLVHPDDPGVTVVPQEVTGGEQRGRLVLERAVIPMDRHLGTVGQGDEVVRWLEQRLIVSACAVQLGTLKGALDLTASYARSREQFGRPIGTFQAVSQRLADGYIDVLGAELTLWQAAWRLDEGLPAETDLSEAKLWAADAGHRIAHTTVHVHGGVGIDLDGEAHRFFTRAKLNEFTLGGATDHARHLGHLLAAEPV